MCLHLKVSDITLIHFGFIIFGGLLILCDLLDNAEPVIDYGDANQHVVPTETPLQLAVARGCEGVTIAVSHLNGDKDKDDHPDSKRQYVH